LLDTYETERIGFARRLVATTDRVFTLATAQGRLARVLRTRFIPWLMPVLFRLPVMRRFLFRNVSQTGIQYRDSPLSRGAVGDVHGGDRLPWVRTSSNHDNFTPLATLHWQVHIYGESPPGLGEACVELGLPLHEFAWQSGMKEAGLRRGALYLVRPDGYVALADPQADAQRLRHCLAQCGLTRQGGRVQHSPNE
jgi:hypothetical protein